MDENIFLCFANYSTVQIEINSKGSYRDCTNL